MDHCPYADFLFDGNYCCELTGTECEGFPCDVASEFEDEEGCEEE
jgi:hypothetical protein